MNRNAGLDPGLDRDLVERLHTRAGHDLAGSSPWPGLDRAIARDRRDRRRAAATGLAALALATVAAALPVTRRQVVEAAGGAAELLEGQRSERGLEQDRRDQDLPAPDQGWTDGLRAAVGRWAATQPGEWKADTASVLWAGDVGGRRRAVVSIHTRRPTPDDTSDLERVQFVRWAGPAGADPGQMRFDGYETSPGPRLASVLTWTRADGGYDVVVVCRECRGVSWRPGATPKEAAGGWLGVAQVGPAAWQASIPAGDLPQVRVVAADRNDVFVAVPQDDGGQFGTLWGPSQEAVAALARGSRLSPEEADACLQLLAWRSSIPGARLQDATVVAAGTADTGVPDGTVDAVLVAARAPGRGWFAVAARRDANGKACGAAAQQDSLSGAVQLPDAPAEQLFAVVELTNMFDRQFAVLAPTGATRVQARTESAAVHGRAALLTLRVGPDDPRKVTIRALGADGTEVGKLTWPDEVAFPG